MNNTHIVLIASQDAEMISTWKTLFEQKNCRVVVERTPRHALQAARLLVPSLIILDLHLPEGEHLSLCGDLRAATNGTLLVIAPRRSATEIANYHFAGVDEILIQPISPMTLLVKSMAWLVRQEWKLPNLNARLDRALT